jgi:TPR repeat protein
MRTLLAALTTLMLFATPVVAGEVEDAIEEGDVLKEAMVAGEVEDAVAAYKTGDYQKALRLWKPMAEQGDAYAQYFLGRMYAKGTGVSEDDAKAVYWYRKAAEQGDAYAQNELAGMYRDGEGVPQNDVHAYAWYGIAAAQEHKIAKEHDQEHRPFARNKGNVEKTMTREQIAKGQELAAEYWEKYVVPFQKD